MESTPAGGSTDDLSSTTPAAVASRWTFAASQKYQILLDKSTPFVLYRWIACLSIALIYVVRVYFVQGFYVVSYAVGIYILNLLIGFLSPQVDPELQDLADDGPGLPTRGSDEFRPFVRRLPEFKFWYGAVDFINQTLKKQYCLFLPSIYIVNVLGAGRIFDVPVFWPILLFYWIVLFALTMRRQISHMIKYKYVPFSFGKQRYDRKKAPSTETDNLLPRD
ncbi:hypothetical protein LguiB_009287 [Lonicera macranthoides]